MKKISLIAALTAMIGFGAMAQTQPAQDNHGKAVSAVAKTEPAAGENHGQEVKAVATDNNGKQHGKKHRKHHKGAKGGGAKHAGGAKHGMGK